MTERHEAMKRAIDFCSSHGLYVYSVGGVFTPELSVRFEQGMVEKLGQPKWEKGRDGWIYLHWQCDGFTIDSCYEPLPVKPVSTEPMPSYV